MKLYNDADPVSNTFKKTLEEEIAEKHNKDKRVPSDAIIQSAVKACQSNTKNNASLI